MNFASFIFSASTLLLLASSCLSSTTKTVNEFKCKKGTDLTVGVCANVQGTKSNSGITRGTRSMSKAVEANAVQGKQLTFTCDGHRKKFAGCCQSRVVDGTASTCVDVTPIPTKEKIP